MLEGLDDERRRDVVGKVGDELRWTRPQRSQVEPQRVAPDEVDVRSSSERGDEGVAKIKELTGGLGAHSVVEAVGTQESMMQAIRSTRAGGHVGYVGVTHGVQLPGNELFFAEVHLLGGPAPVRRFLPDLIGATLRGEIDPGRVFDLDLPAAVDDRTGMVDARDGTQMKVERVTVTVALVPPSPTVKLGCAN